MSKQIDIKKISGEITQMAFQNIGYGELKQYIFNILVEIVNTSFTNGLIYKSNKMKETKKLQEKILNEKFNDILNELI